MLFFFFIFIFFFNQKTAYDMRISDWSSDVCSSDLPISLQSVEETRLAARDDLATAVLADNRAAGRRIAVAESCTGGMVSAALTDIAGSSDVFSAGFVTYSGHAKQSQLDVSSEILETFGEVSLATAWAMAAGVLANSDADVAVAITGLAGPGGGSEKKPVGPVVFARALREQDPDDYFTSRVQFQSTHRRASRPHSTPFPTQLRQQRNPRNLRRSIARNRLGDGGGRAREQRCRRRGRDHRHCRAGRRVGEEAGRPGRLRPRAARAGSRRLFHPARPVRIDRPPRNPPPCDALRARVASAGQGFAAAVGGCHPPRAVKFVGAGFERRDHLPERLVEHLPGERLEHATAEREIDHEVDAAAAVLEGMEMPFVAQMLHRAVDIADDDLVRPLLVDAARKALAQPLEADDHVGDGFMLAVAAAAERDDPRQKLGIARDRKSTRLNSSH